jgi:adenosylcobinamide kinase/adenosylcobinamide-phosphate guanylyltransferase
MAETILILGGAKSGKSALALRAAAALAEKRVFVATAQAYDDEMRLRIARHQAERGPTWRSVEEPLDLCGLLGQEDSSEKVILVDCLTLWMSNLMTQGGLTPDEITRRSQELCQILPGMKANVVLVSNEVGLGIVPENALARAFRDHAGALNQSLAKTCDKVAFVAAGLPLMLKGSELEQKDWN